MSLDLSTVALAAMIAGSSIADVETTRACVNSGMCRELSPTMAPLISSRIGAYSAKGAVGLGVSVLGAKLRRSPRKAERVLGWALPGLMIGAQSLAAAHNARR